MSALLTLALFVVPFAAAAAYNHAERHDWWVR